MSEDFVTIWMRVSKATEDEEISLHELKSALSAHGIALANSRGASAGKLPSIKTIEKNLEKAVYLLVDAGKANNVDSTFLEKWSVDVLSRTKSIREAPFIGDDVVPDLFFFKSFLD
jgi:hypothetical protein